MSSCNQYCRLCLTEDKWGSPVHILNPVDRSLDICEIIEKLLGINISKEDGLLDVLCRKCIGLITIFMEFRDKVIRNDKLLKSVIKASVTSDNAHDPVVVKRDVGLGNRRRPGPISKRKPMKTHELSKIIVTEKLPTNTPTHPTDKTEVQSSIDPTPNPTTIQYATSDNSDTTTPLYKSANQEDSSDNSVSTILLDRTKNVGNSVTPDSDSTMELDQSRLAHEQIPQSMTTESLGEWKLDNSKGGEISALEKHGEPSKACSNPKRRGRPTRILHVCEHCNRPFMNSKDLKNHKLLHKRLSTKLFLCRYCCMAYGSENEVKLHYKYYHPFSTLDSLKQKELEHRSILTAISNTSTHNTATSNSINFDLIESVEPTPKTSNKRKRNSKQVNASKKVKFSANKSSIMTVADVHSPIQSEQTNETSTNNTSNVDTNLTVAEIHTQQPIKELKSSSEIHTSPSEQPATNMTNSEINSPSQLPATTEIKGERYSKNDYIRAEIRTPEQPAKESSAKKWGENSNVSAVIEKHTPTQLKQTDKTSSNDDSSLVIVSSEEEMIPSPSLGTSDEDNGKYQDEKLGKSSFAYFSVPKPVTSELPTPAKVTLPAVKVIRLDSPQKDAKVCNICNAFTSTSMKEIFMHKRRCK